MKPEFISLRTFIGAKNFDVSREFYSELGFEEKILSDKLSLMQQGKYAFYLQDYYAEDWLNNTMLFIEVENAAACFVWLTELQLKLKYPGVKVIPLKKDYWGEECFVIDPSGVLLHFGQFYEQS